jgi:outer membrane immunogenic protein
MSEIRRRKLRFTKLSLLCATSAIAIAAGTGAQAQDMRTTGFYAGIHAGFASGTQSGTVENVNTSAGLDDAESLGPIAGVQMGYNFATGSDLLIGAEVSVSAGHSTDSMTRPFFGGGQTLYVERELTGLALVQGKLGWSVGEVSVYGLGGLAFATGSLSDGEGSVSFAGDTFYNGWTLGAGVDVAVTENVSIGAAYNYVDLSANEVEANRLVVNQDLNSHIAKLVLNYHF